MGVCVSRPLQMPTTPQPLTNLPLNTEERPQQRDDSSQPLESSPAIKRKSVFSGIDSNIPNSFCPPILAASLTEELCRATHRKITAAADHESVRLRTEELLCQWKHSGMLGQIEIHALSISTRQLSSVRELAMALADPAAIYLKTLGNVDGSVLDVAKAYAVYFWIANNIRHCPKIWRSFLANPDKVKSKITPNAVLKSRESFSLGFSSLFCSIATNVGLTAHSICGNLKLNKAQMMHEGGENVPTQFEMKVLNQHYWNAIKIHGKWVLLDCAFGAGMITPHNDFSSNYTQDYFLAPPEAMILTHSPTDSQWQLLKKPVSQEELAPMIAPPLACYHSKLQPLSWAEEISTQSSRTATVVLQFTAPSNLQLSANLSRKESRDLDSGNMQCNGESNLEVNQLQQATYIHRMDDEVNVYVAVPAKGNYVLIIYANASKGNLLCLSYLIHCPVTPKEHTCFPTTFRRASTAFGFKLLYWNTPHMAQVCENDAGKLDIVFQSDPSIELKFYHCLIPGNASGRDINVELEGQNFYTTLTHDMSNPSLHKLSCIFPKRGWWTVYLCATKISSELGTMGYTALLCHPFYVKSAMRKCSYPHTHTTDIQFRQSQPISSNGEEVLEVPFYSTKNLSFHSFLTQDKMNSKQQKTYTYIQTLDGFSSFGEYQYLLKVIFPYPGQWYVQVYAHEITHSSCREFSALFNLYLHVDGCISNALFPVIVREVMQKFDIIFPENYPVYYNENEQPLCFEFQAPKDINFVHLIEPVSDRSDRSEDVFKGNYTYLSIRGTDANATLQSYLLKAVIPHKGQWNISLLASKQVLSEPQLAVQITVNITQHISTQVFPKIHPAYHKLGVRISEEYFPYEKSTNQPEFSLKLTTPDNLHLAWVLEDISAKDQNKFSAQAFLNHERNEEPSENRHLHLIFPKPGFWLIRVSGKTILSDIVADASLSLSLNYQPLFDIVIRASNSSLGHMSFPTVFEPFYSKYSLNIDRVHLPIPSITRQLPTTVTIKFYSPPDVEFWHEGKEARQYADNHMTRMMSSPDTRMHDLVTEITQPGQWTVTLYAKHVGDSSKSWTTVLRHTIQAKGHRQRSSSKLY